MTAKRVRSVHFALEGTAVNQQIAAVLLRESGQQMMTILLELV